MNTNTDKKEQGLLFFGNQHETVPTRLLFDPYLTSRAKLAWQLIKYKAKEFQSGLFPSYEVLSNLLSDKAYEDAQLSKKLVSQTLLLLRLTRWLTLCETVRNDQGQVMGNIYLLHDEPMPIIDTIQLNHDYLHLLESAVKHNDPTVRGVASHIVQNLLSDNTQWHYISHIDWMKSRYEEYKDRVGKNDHITDKQQTYLDEMQQKLLSSQMELSKKTQELSHSSLSSNMELSSKQQSSHTELSKEKSAKSLISGLVPNGNSVKSQYSTSTSIYTNTYCTGNVNEINWPENIKLSELEKHGVMQMMKNLDLGICNALMFEMEQRVRLGEIKKPYGYLLRLIQLAHKNEFKPYLYEQSLANQSSKSKTELSRYSEKIIQNNELPSLSAEERLARSESIRQFKASLSGIGA